MKFQIVYADEIYFEELWKVIDSIAREQKYLEMIEAPPLAEIIEFQNKLIQQKSPCFYALDGDHVVGWLDIAVYKNPRMNHRGTLGMGILKSHRGRGLGKALMEKALAYARSIGLEKVELQVYPENTQAVELYKKYGFRQYGYLKHYRKLEGQYFDTICMELFL